MALKNTWTLGQTFTHADQNAVATQVNANADAIAGKQAQDTDLTAIAGLSPANDDVLQRKSGSWVSRTLAQLKADLAIAWSDVSKPAVIAAGNDQAAARTAIGAASSADLTAQTAAISAREPAVSAGTTSQYWRGDKTWQTLPDTTIRTGVFPFELCNASNTWANTQFGYRREFAITQDVKRFRVHWRNRGQLTDATGGAVTGLTIGVGVPALDTNGLWNGNTVATPVTVQASTAVAAGAEQISPWITPNTFKIDPYKRYVLTYGFTTAATGALYFGGGVGYQSFAASDALLAVPAAGPSRTANAGFGQVWIEYEFTDDSTPVLFVVGNSLSNGTTAGGDSMGELSSFAGIWATSNRGTWANVGVAGAFAGSFQSGNTRWDVYDSCNTPLDPDVVLYFAAPSSDVVDEGGTITASKSNTVNMLLKGKAKFPNARHIITDIPPRADFSGTSSSGLEKARLDMNSWLHLLPGQVESCIDTQFLSNRADPARLWGPYNGDNVHFSPAGHAAVAANLPVFGRRTA